MQVRLRALIITLPLFVMSVCKKATELPAPSALGMTYAAERARSDNRKNKHPPAHM